MPKNLDAILYFVAIITFIFILVSAFYDAGVL